MARNADIIEHSEIVVAWPGTTGGTAFGLSVAKYLNLPAIDLSKSEKNITGLLQLLATL
jgi:hypothetical protein